MTEAILCLGLGLAGAVVGAFASRVRASGSIAVLLALLPGAGLWVASGSN